MIQWFLDRCKSSIVPLIEVEERMMMKKNESGMTAINIVMALALVVVGLTCLARLTDWLRVYRADRVYAAIMAKQDVEREVICNDQPQIVRGEFVRCVIGVSGTAIDIYARGAQTDPHALPVIHRFYAHQQIAQK